MDNDIKSFRDLNIWKQGITLVKNTYFLTDKFPANEKYGLANQMQRAAVSIPSNIAEGHSNLHTKEYKRYLSIALGSLAELETQAVIASELKYISQNHCQQFIDKILEITKQIRAILKKLNSP